MRRYIVSYDLYRPGHNYSDLTAEIKRLGNDWEHPLANLWLVETELSADDIRDRLSDHLIAGDKLYVRQAGKDIAALDIAPGSPCTMRAVTATPRAPVKLLANVLPESNTARDSRLLTAAIAESW